VLTFGDLFDDGCLYNQEFALAYFDYLNGMIEGFVEAVWETGWKAGGLYVLRIKEEQATHE
jgi:hypothetical protein